MNVNTYIKKLFRIGLSIDEAVDNISNSFYSNTLDDVKSHVSNMYYEFKHEIIQDMLFIHNIYKFKDIRFLLKDYYIIDDATDQELKQALKDLV